MGLRRRHLRRLRFTFHSSLAEIVELLRAAHAATDADAPRIVARRIIDLLRHPGNIFHSMY